MIRTVPRRRIGDTITSIPPHSQGYREAANEADEIPRDTGSLRVLALLVVVGWLAARGLYETGRDVLSWLGA